MTNKGLHFRVLDQERENQSEDEEYADDKEEPASPEPQKKKVHPLEKLRDSRNTLKSFLFLALTRENMT